MRNSSILLSCVSCVQSVQKKLLRKPFTCTIQVPAKFTHNLPQTFSTFSSLSYDLHPIIMQAGISAWNRVSNVHFFKQRKIYIKALFFNR